MEQVHRIEHETEFKGRKRREFFEHYGPNLGPSTALGIHLYCLYSSSNVAMLVYLSLTKGKLGFKEMKKLFKLIQLVNGRAKNQR